MVENIEPGSETGTQASTSSAATVPPPAVTPELEAKPSASEPEAPVGKPTTAPAAEADTATPVAAPKVPARRRAPAKPKAAAAPVEKKAPPAKSAAKKPPAKPVATRAASARANKPAAKAEAVAPTRVEPIPVAAAAIQASPPNAPKKVAALAKPVASKPVKEDTKAEKKDKKEKVVRDSFSMPKSEHVVIKQLRTEIARAGRIVSKSEILRAALKVLAEQGPVKALGLVEALSVVPKGKAKKS